MKSAWVCSDEHSIHEVAAQLIEDMSERDFRYRLCDHQISHHRFITHRPTTHRTTDLFPSREAQAWSCLMMETHHRNSQRNQGNRYPGLSILLSRFLSFTCHLIMQHLCQVKIFALNRRYRLPSQTEHPIETLLRLSIHYEK